MTSVEAQGAETTHLAGAVPRHYRIWLGRQRNIRRFFVSGRSTSVLRGSSYREVHAARLQAASTPGAAQGRDVRGQSSPSAMASARRAEPAQAAIRW